MQPLIVAEETRRGVADYLMTTFPGTTPGFDTLMERFLAEPTNLAKGPFITLGLPFQKASAQSVPFEWLSGFVPHTHQARAFARLSASVDTSKPAIDRHLKTGHHGWASETG